jgi:hypothetical protein
MLPLTPPPVDVTTRMVDPFYIPPLSSESAVFFGFFKQRNMRQPVSERILMAR